jgi:hypothetical protein
MDDEMKAWRVAAVEALQPVPYLFTWAFEFTPPSSEAVDTAYLRKVRESQFVLWLAGASTTTPVRNEVSEALRTHRRLLVFRLPFEERDAATLALLEATPEKWSPELDSIEEFQTVLRDAIADEVVRVLEEVPSLAPLAQYERLGRESRARCASRWVMAGIERSEALAWAGDATVSPLPARLQDRQAMGLLTLVGGMGAGKSLCADRWFQQCVSWSADDHEAPVPVYLEAGDVSLPLLDAIRVGAKDFGDVDVQGANVVLEDLSRCDDVRAGRILEQAHQVSAFLPTTTILITSRPIPAVTAADRDSAIAMDPLDEEESLEVVRRAHGGDISRVRYRDWSPSLREAIRWPLFAILTGVYLRENDLVTRITYSELLTFLIERSLGLTAASRYAATSLLRRLAALSLESRDSLVPLAEVGKQAELSDLLASDLVEVRGRNMSIPLDILREWLAAQSIAKGEPGVDELLDDPKRLNRWRYPIMASIGSSSFKDSVELLAPLFARRPGLAARMISEETPEYAAGRDAMPVADVTTAGRQVRVAMDSWRLSLWPASLYLHSVDDEGRLRGLDIAARGQKLETSWRRHGAGPPVMAVETSTPIDRRQSHHIAQPSAMLTWPWNWTLSEVRSRLGHLVRAKNVPLAEGPLVCECAYAVARAVIGTGVEDGDPIPVGDMAKWLTQLRAQPGHFVSYSKWTAKGIVEFDPAQLERAVDYLTFLGLTVLEKPYPAPDYLAGLKLVDGGWLGKPVPAPHSEQEPTDTWKWFGGDDGVRDAVRRVLETSLDGYIQSAQAWFPRLQEDLAHRVLQPAEVRVRLFRPEQPGWRGEMALMLLPRERDSENVVDISVDTDDKRGLSFEDQLVWGDEQAARIEQYRPDAAWWIRPTVHQDDIPLFGRLPASRLAMLWLYLDLLDLSLIEGMRPRYSDFW